jgi:hypothetical protein
MAWTTSPTRCRRLGWGRTWATTGYGDEKVANRDTKVWHGATEKGP